MPHFLFVWFEISSIGTLSAEKSYCSVFTHCDNCGDTKVNYLPKCVVSPGLLLVQLHELDDVVVEEGFTCATHSHELVILVELYEEIKETGACLIQTVA